MKTTKEQKTLERLGTLGFISFEYNNENWTIRESCGGCEFYVENDRVRVCFTAEGRNGSTYSSVKSVWNKVSDRVYTAQRYLYKYTALVSESAYILAKNGYLWDYEKGCPLSESREKALSPYYEKCKKLGLSLNNPIYEKMNVKIFELSTF